MKLRVAIPLIAAICLGSPAMASSPEEQMVKGRGARDRSAGSGGSRGGSAGTSSGAQRRDGGSAAAAPRRTAERAQRRDNDGGSARVAVLARLMAEVAEARAALPALQLVLGHGSGSYGHVEGAQHGTRQGVSTPAQWRGMAEVQYAAGLLNRLVVDAAWAAGVPVLNLPPSASRPMVPARWFWSRPPRRTRRNRRRPP